MTSMGHDGVMDTQLTPETIYLKHRSLANCMQEASTSKKISFYVVFSELSTTSTEVDQLSSCLAQFLYSLHSSAVDDDFIKFCYNLLKTPSFVLTADQPLRQQ
jgi:hypothetical protein